jgi:hypothetical protein
MDCFNFLFCKSKKSDFLQEPLLEEQRKIIVNCYYIKSNFEDNIVTIEVFRKRIGANIPKFLPVNFPNSQLEFLTCIDAFYDIKALCDDCNYHYYFMRTIEVDEDKFNNDYIITYNSSYNKYRLQKLYNNTIK